ncbi:MAG: metallophosphoesterase [Clostridia bacterium]|nr:metallophosphoesterase [Clostridia bacterium]
MGKITPKYENCLLSCVIVSDMHIDKKHPMPWLPKWMLKRSLSDCENAAVRQDAFIGVGDTTSRGNAVNWEMTEDCFKKHPSPADHILLALGNHDTWNDNGYDDAINEYYRAMKIICGRDFTKQFFSQNIKGYKFIIMGSIGDVGDAPVIGEEQLLWLDKELCEGADGGKPVFVFNHQALNGRHGLPDSFSANPPKDVDPMEGGIGKESEAVEKLLKKHKNVFFFSGHSHMGFCSEQWKKQNGFSNFEEEDGLVMVNLPSLSCGNHSCEDNRNGDGIVMEVYSDKVLLRLRDFRTRKWMENLAISNGKPYFEKKL